MKLLSFKPFKSLITVFLAAYSTCFAHSSLAQSSHYEIPRISYIPEIDGVVSAGEWDSATRIEVNIETDPGYNTVAEVRTEALVMEDGDVLYVAFIAEDDDIDQVRAFFRDRDGIWRDDRVGVVI